MAALGAIGIITDTTGFWPFDIAWAWDISKNPAQAIDGSGAFPKRENWKTLSGVIRDSSLTGVARRYSVFRRSDNLCIGSGTSNADGTFICKVPFADAVFLVAFDTAGANAIILDNIIPV